MPSFEAVYTVHEYYDGPRQGVASFEGQPVFYDCIFSESDDGYTGQYQLTPLPIEILPLILEDWKIWQRWESAFQSGETTIDSHPALPLEKPRQQELSVILAPYLKTDTSKCIIRIGRFHPLQGQTKPRGVLREMRVEWALPDERNGID